MGLFEWLLGGHQGLPKALRKAFARPAATRETSGAWSLFASSMTACASASIAFGMFDSNLVPTLKRPYEAFKPMGKVT